MLHLKVRLIVKKTDHKVENLIPGSLTLIAAMLYFITFNNALKSFN
jgi:hypothetical protein